MTRGKHSTAAGARRLKAAQEEAEAFRKAYQQEARAHKITKAAADRIDGLEAELKKLRMDLDLATSDELREAQQEAIEARRVLADSILWAVAELSHADCGECGAKGSPRGIGVNFWHKIHAMIGAEAACEIWQNDTRARRRNRRRWSDAEWRRIMDVVTSGMALGLDGDAVNACVQADLNGPDQLRIMEATRRNKRIAHALADVDPTLLGV